MGPPGGGANMITGRFLRHMQIMCMDAFDDSTLTKIFCSILEWHFAKGFDEKITRLTKVTGFFLSIFCFNAFFRTTDDSFCYNGSL